ncbi:amino acid ABC transporter ATP-binding/permease protein [Fannyhessea vaginae]|uniref:amino acid ABC transporter ATP-binding/permease protein n=1 Tax=Fannyhessea vaginae TaxID=82135 RepID=UPI003A806B9A
MSAQQHTTNPSPIRQHKRTALSCILAMLKLIHSFIGVVVAATVCGILGFLCAIFIPVGALIGLGMALHLPSSSFGGYSAQTTLTLIIGILICLALMRGALRYLEQLCNHYIAFKLLADIRDKVFGKMRELTPAKLSSSDAGNLISLITSDVELLEVFYAHTISPIFIALIVSTIMTILLACIHPLCGLVALISYAVTGILLPLWTYRRMGSLGKQLRSKTATLSNCVLENIQGVRVARQFLATDIRKEHMIQKSHELLQVQKISAAQTGFSTSVSHAVVMLCSLSQLALTYALVTHEIIMPLDGIIATGMLFSSFGPVLALAKLGSTLQGTLAAGERVLSLLDEAPLVRNVVDGSCVSCDNAAARNVSFLYEHHQNPVLENVSCDIPQGSIVGITGASGSGKSTLCRLLMRFWDVSKGVITISKTPIQDITTTSLRSGQALVEQDTYLFRESIKDNIRLARPTASFDEIVHACKQASLHDFIMSLPHGYDTVLAQGSSSLSGGQRQRIGVARAFLHQGSMLLLDEPTSNLDALNEARVLTSISQIKRKRTIVLISHRTSTLNCADKIYHVESGKLV